MPIGKHSSIISTDFKRADSSSTITGELFDLEALSRTCAELDRYSFFMTSMPLNMPGGVSSPPNAMAIF